MTARTRTHGASRKARCRCRGLTTRDLLAAAILLLLLVVLLVPALAYGRTQARDVACHGHLRRLWVAAHHYANSFNGALFVNEATPLRISNVIFKNHRSTGWGVLYPRYLSNYGTFFCPADPGRGPAWKYGWSNWGGDNAEVQCSYGYRGRQDFVASAGSGLTWGMIEAQPTRALGCDYYEPFFAPPRVHHKNHVNVLRGSGRVEDVKAWISFGPGDVDVRRALDAIDR